MEEQRKLLSAKKHSAYSRAMSARSNGDACPLSGTKTVIVMLIAVAAFTLAYSVNGLGFLLLGFVYCLLLLTKTTSNRKAFYPALFTGFACYMLQLDCFWKIFGPGAVALWTVLAFWIGLFVLLARHCFKSFRPIIAAALIPFLWTGLEYFRSELYYLRFSWLNISYAFSDHVTIPIIGGTLHWFGMYGFGFVAVAIVSPALILKRKHTAAYALCAGLVIMIAGLVPSKSAPSEIRSEKGIVIAGVQLEFPAEDEIVPALDGVIGKYPDADLFFLCEYTLDGPPPESLKGWCRTHGKYLLVGGKESAPQNDFYNTAFVLGPDGEIVFRQVKAVPIQFMKDGLPAQEQTLWNSPWGKIGICVCYDLSYTRVTDRLIKLGAEALLVPTMDVVDWGRRERELHARVTPIRCAEYGVPIFRVASSGISQFADSRGRILAEAGFPGEGEMISAKLQFHGSGRLPFDRILAPISTGITLVLIVYFTANFWRGKFTRYPKAVPRSENREPATFSR